MVIDNYSKKGKSKKLSLEIFQREEKYSILSLNHLKNRGIY
jgi:hypothetical protein